MPETTITINREQRDGLYELVRNHLGSVGDLWHALEQERDFARPHGSASSSAKTSNCWRTSAGARTKAARALS